MLSVADRPVFQKQKHLTKAKRRELKSRSPLEHALYVAGIPKLKTETVRRYMQKKMNDFCRPQQRTIETREHRPFSCVCAFLGLLFAACLSQVAPISGNLLSGAFGVLFVWAIYGEKKIIFSTVLSRPAAAWQTTLLRQFKGSVPEEVREKAGEITACLPDAQCLVHHFYEDPFLEVVLERKEGHRESAFIGFWDETGFHNR